ncbi:MAG TPA: hypothetical protein VN738_07985, partial [Acidothermaceae bacterium]|nr:hypothetical protein [Acidothermaceae bacterium]
MPIPRGMLAPTGEKGTVHYGAVFAVRDGRIATQHVYPIERPLSGQPARPNWLPHRRFRAH